MAVLVVTEVCWSQISCVYMDFFNAISDTQNLLNYRSALFCTHYIPQCTSVLHIPAQIHFIVAVGFFKSVYLGQIALK